jgi:hypothetical protein
VAALFVDIKDWTQLEQDPDPEDALAINDPALKLMIDRCGVTTDTCAIDR